MEQRRSGSGPLGGRRRQWNFAGLFTAPMLLIAFASGPCGEREAVSSQRPRVWEACGQARRAGAPQAQSTGFPCPSTARDEWVGALQAGSDEETDRWNAMMVQGGVRG